MSTRIVQITDCHLYADPESRLDGLDTAATLARVVERLRQDAPPDLLLATGDLAQAGEVGAYRRLAEQLEGIEAPLLALPGNHDERAAMRAGLAGAQFGGQYAFGSWRVAGLDTLVPGQAGGRLAGAALDDLERRLATCDGFWLIALHHPPIAIGSRWMDAMGLANGVELMALAGRFSDRVKALVWGHNHQIYDGWQDGIRLLGTPSTCIQYLPGSDDYAVDPAPPGYRWLELHDDGAVSTGVVRVDD
jgi:Icc protein